ncbi:MAG: HIT domain-containing protein [Fimbriiglobus sp.]|jgi:ATP adenylyltransferase|nr:HIT domain-containing protein [Fimbriiglobus sp.]
MDHLWAPWRLSYVSTPKPPGSPAEECFVCKALADTDDRANRVVRRTERAAVFLNAFPYNNGHLLVVPHAHVGRLDQLSAEVSGELQRVLVEMIAKLESLMSPHGFNVGLNLGAAAGAGVPGHLHWHIVPRWNGDTNFMPVLTDTKVISQSLDALYDLLTNG